jgi:hypothetical protein
MKRSEDLDVIAVVPLTPAKSFRSLPFEYLGEYDAMCETVQVVNQGPTGI